MLFNYLKLSLRLLVRNPFFTFINVIGLSVGFVAFFILWQHSGAELKADQYHKDYERIARIGAHWRWVEESGYQGHLVWRSLLAYQSGMVLSDFPTMGHTRFIEQGDFRTSVVGMSSNIITSVEEDGHEPRTFKETGLIYADPNLFEFFTIPLVLGEPASVLKRPKSVVLSERTAKRYFGGANPLNQVVTVNDTISFLVTGVFEDLPLATHLDFDIVLSNAGQERQWDNPTVFTFTRTYVKLASPEEFEAFAKQLNKTGLRYWQDLNKIGHGSGEMFLQPLQDTAFGEGIADSEGLKGSKSRASLLILQVVALVILIMAWINYMNLTVSRIKKRSKEMATRKVSGAHAKDFMMQFLIESVLLNAISIGVALTVIQLIRQPFQEYFEMQVTDFQAPLQLWIPIACFVLSGILITAMYPTYLCARYSPKTLHDAISNPAATKVASSLLTTLQYVAAFVLISWAFVIYSQLVYSLEKNSVAVNQILIVDAPIVKPRNYISDVSTFLNQLQERFSVTFSSAVNGDGGLDRLGIKQTHHDEYDYYDCDGGVDETFVPFFGIKLLAGRNFGPNESEHSILLSRIAAERMEFKNVNEAIGENVNVVRLGDPLQSAKTLEIVGVYEDYHIASTLSRGIGEGHDGSSLVFKDKAFAEFVPDRIEIRMARENFRGSIPEIENMFHSTFPGSAFNWYFMDEHLNREYSQEIVVRNQIVLFTSLAIAIACLGLLGIIANNAEEKTKEIGIRKVLGAGMNHIATVLLRSTLFQVLIAASVSIPAAYFLSQDYLQHYRDRIGISWWHLAAPSLILVLVMLGSVVTVLYKAATNNPVEALKYE